MVKVGINGFGRIGRLVLRALVESGRKDVQIVAINDLANAQTLCHLYNYDSVHGSPVHKLEPTTKGLSLNGQEIVVTADPNPSTIDWDQAGVEMVFECTGRFVSKTDASQHIRGGVKRVLISAPGKEVDHTVVFGVNHTTLTSDHTVVSNASCTTNCLAPAVHVLDEVFGFERGYMTTIHAYTADQRLVDTPHSDLRRARAGALSMIPTSTGAAKAVGLVLPHLNGKLDGCAVRVPTPNVSAVDLTFTAKEEISVDKIKDAFVSAAQGQLKGVLAATEEPLVSCDFNHNPASSVIDLAQVQVVEGKMGRIFSWYDNEWGFSNRMLDTASYWAGL